MDGLAPTEEQRELGATLRRFLADTSDLATVRNLADTADGFDRGTWARMAAEIGIQALGVPERYDGLGQGPLEADVVHEELGRALHPGPLLATMTATDAIVLADDEQACAELLPDIATGETIATLAMPEHTSATAEHVGDHWSITGSASFVLFGQCADVIIVPVDDTLFAVQPGENVEPTAQSSLDLTRRFARLDFHAAPARPIGAPGTAGQALNRTLSRFRAAVAAEQAGGAAACLEASVAHAKEHTQFGKPIGAFQAIAHKCVDMLQQVEFARAGARYAAAAAASDHPEAELASHVAAAHAGTAYRQVTTETIQVHGGMGFTWEHDTHLYYRRAFATEQLTGGPDTHRCAITTLAGL